MLKIILCEDDLFVLNQLADCLKQTIRRLGLPAMVVCMASGESEVMCYLRQNPGVYLYFMDLDLGIGSLNGIDLSRNIRALHGNSKIVFVTGFADKGMDILKSGIEPFGFMEKSLNPGQMALQFERYLNMALSSLRMDRVDEEPCITLHIGVDETMQLPLRRILYVEAMKTHAHHIGYHTLDHSVLTVRDTIAHACESMGEGFLLCHRSILVNRDHIIGLVHGQIRLSDGTQVACAYGKQKSIQQAIRWRKEQE